MQIEIESILKNFFSFIKNPQETFNEKLTLNKKWGILFSILVLDFLFVFITSIFLSLVDSYLFKLDSDPIENIFVNKSAFSILMLAAIVIPFIEEFIFRFFLKYKRNLVFHFIDFLTKQQAKLFWVKNFKFFFYGSAILFALMHLSNFNNTNLLFYFLAPLIVLPQFIGGISLGYIRLKLGFSWGVFKHGLYNFIIFSGLFIFNTSSLTTIDNLDYSLQISKLQLGLNKPSNITIYKSNLKIDSIVVTNSELSEFTHQMAIIDTIYLKNPTRINLKFINKSGTINTKSIIKSELDQHFKK